MSLIKGTHHVALKCKSAEEFEKTILFYTKVLGLEIIRSWGEGDDAGIMLNTGNSILEIFAAGKVSDSTGSVHHFALATDDVDACVAAVREAGYPITTEPEDIVIPSTPGMPARIAFCIGPVGEEIEFFTEK
ncbi:MAG: VOC family protein [Lachnospiraceae bacterium]|nr:VOC family protein [Lachnospiraceae bacterium]